MDGNTLNSEILEARKIIGSWLKQMREDKGLTQEQVADKLGVGKQTVSKIEAGRWSFSIDYINRFAQALDFYVFFIPKDSKDPLAETMRNRWGEMQDN
jgi:transcriptional regulator with XRE-family HTH domain